jgi:hypothetical protein
MPFGSELYGCLQVPVAGREAITRLLSMVIDMFVTACVRMQSRGDGRGTCVLVTSRSRSGQDCRRYGVVHRSMCVPGWLVE